MTEDDAGEHYRKLAPDVSQLNAEITVFGTVTFVQDGRVVSKTGS